MTVGRPLGNVTTLALVQAAGGNVATLALDEVEDADDEGEKQLSNTHVITERRKRGGCYVSRWRQPLPRFTPPAMSTVGQLVAAARF